jgi:hypothetical protein
MSIFWPIWSDGVAVWWGFLLTVSAANITCLVLLLRLFRQQKRGVWTMGIEPWGALCTAYVVGCAFRSVLPRADIQRICLFDTWFSTVLVGRSVATIAEICFAIQWAIALRVIAVQARSDLAVSASKLVVPLIVLAECCSWYAVITTNYLGNAVENSLWAATFLLIAAAALPLVKEFHGLVRIAIAAALAGITAYAVFMVTVDVPMYLGRWREELADGTPLFGLFGGLYDLGTRVVVTRDFAQWRDEIAWMSLYFSVAVWSSLALCAFGLVKDRLPQYCVNAARPVGWPRPGRTTAD